MDFYPNIHKSGGDRGSSITASPDPVARFNYSARRKARGWARTAEAAPGERRGRGGRGGQGAGEKGAVFAASV